MTPTETLKHEHQIILTVLGAAEWEVDSIRATGAVHGEDVRGMLDFIREFADRCHHAKEEKLLFRKLEERGMPRDAGPLAVMLNEHDRGREFVREAERSLPDAETGDREALKRVAKSLAGYSDLLRSHIAKEDTVLYPMADRLLSPLDQRELEAAFERIEVEMGLGTHAKYHALAMKLTRETISQE